MGNPFKYRPDDPDDLDWEDNWLSNAMAWATSGKLGTICSEPGTWAVKVTDYLWTSCACCLLVRGFLLGALSAATPVAIFVLLKGFI